MGGNETEIDECACGEWRVQRVRLCWHAACTLNSIYTATKAQTKTQKPKWNAQSQIRKLLNLCGLEPKQRGQLYEIEASWHTRTIHKHRLFKLSKTKRQTAWRGKKTGSEIPPPLLIKPQSSEYVWIMYMCLQACLTLQLINTHTHTYTNPLTHLR